jgi:predicted ATPase
MALLLKFGEGGAANAYSVRLRGTEYNMLVISDEAVLYRNRETHPGLFKEDVSTYTKESELKDYDSDCTRQAMRDIDSYRVYHFHDTSDTAEVKSSARVEDNRALRPHAENLAAFLYWMQEKRPDHFANIEDAIRQIAPFFDEFRLEPSKLNESIIRLEWREKGSDAYFDATSLSDGTLRFICLVTLLLQPDLPPVVLLDEPELGLHPAAIAILADLLSSAATRAQIIVATQSATLVNHFSPQSVWTVDRKDNQSVFRHLAGEDMTAWLDDYALGELWEKNVLGARP